MPPNSPVGQDTVKHCAWKPPPAIACAPSPVALAQHDREPGERQARGSDEHPADMANERGLLRLRPDHEARRVAERDDRQIVGVAKLKDARSLVGGVRVDRGAEVFWVAGDEAERAALDPNERGHDPEPEGRAQLQNGAFGRRGSRRPRMS
jgi:hypothetical protein